MMKPRANRRNLVYRREISVCCFALYLSCVHSVVKGRSCCGNESIERITASLLIASIFLSTVPIMQRLNLPMDISVALPDILCQIKKQASVFFAVFSKQIYILTRKF